MQLPSSAADLTSPEVAADMQRYVRWPGVEARERVKLLKLLWHLIGSEFAGRHVQYEMFYAGQPAVVKAKEYRAYDWAEAEPLPRDASPAAQRLWLMRILTTSEAAPWILELACMTTDHGCLPRGRLRARPGLYLAGAPADVSTTCFSVGSLLGLLVLTSLGLLARATTALA